MKIGTLTFHQSTNYGGVLQAFALQKAISTCGAACEIANYRCMPIWKGNYPLKNCTDIRSFASALLRVIPQNVKNRNFKNFRDKYMKISNNEYTRETLSIMNNDYDKFVVGSDQIWRNSLTDNDLTYFLDFTDSDKKYSYAASLGTVELEEDQRKCCKKYLSDFTGISVREEVSKTCLEKILDREVMWHVDPVFLLGKEEWEKMICDRKVKKPYIFVFRLHEDKVYDFAKKLSKQTELSVVSLEVNMKGMKGAKKDYFASVEDFLNYIYYADYVVTDSFHGTSFSLIFNKQFYTFLQSNKNGMNGRLSSLLKLVGCESRKVISESDYDIVTDKIDYKKVEANLRPLIDISKKYLNQICDRE